MRVQPSASKNEVVDFAGDVLRIKVAAPPVRDKANKELLAFLSHVLGVSKSQISVIKGHTSRNKIIAIAGLTGEDIIQKLSL